MSTLPDGATISTSFIEDVGGVHLCHGVGDLLPIRPFNAVLGQPQLIFIQLLEVRFELLILVPRYLCLGKQLVLFRIGYSDALR